jgi:hypothetical protein
MWYPLLVRAEKALAAEISDADQRNSAGREKEKVGNEAVKGSKVKKH